MMRPKIKMNGNLTKAERRKLLKQHQRYVALYYFVLGLTIGLALLLGLFFYGSQGPKENFIRDMFKGEEIDELSNYLSKLENESVRLKEELERTQELIKIDRETRAGMTLLINNLESENARLKEDLAFFEGFVPGSAQTGITLRRLQVTKDAIPNQYRYKALVLQGASKPTVDMDVQILVTVSRNNELDTLVFPDDSEADNAIYKVELKRFARVNGTFKIPDETKLEKVEVRLSASGSIRAQTTLKL